MEQEKQKGVARQQVSIIITWRLNSQLRHAGLDPVSSVFLDSAKASLLVPPTRE